MKKTLRFLILSVLSLCLTFLSAISASASYGFQKGGIYYNITSSSDHTCSVTKGDNRYKGDIVIPESVSFGKSTYSVTEIESSVFEGCSSLTSVAIPNSVISIGDNAFQYCNALTSVSIPNSVITIGSNAFENCTGLKSLTLGSSVTTIGTKAFRYCTGLTSVIIPNSVTEIGCNAFETCQGLTSVTIGNSVEKIDYYAFRGCTGLTSITIPSSVTTIAAYAFRNCTGITSVTLEDGSSTIEMDYNYYSNGAYYGMFSDCPLKRVYIGRNLSYKYSPFKDQLELTEVTFGNSVTEISDKLFTDCTGITGMTLGNSVTTIGGSAFEGCTGLTGVVFPNSLTSIGSTAFKGCSAISGVSFPSYLTTIGTSAFSRCVGLKSLTVPSTVTEIGGAAFYGCDGISIVTIEDGSDELEMGYNVFRNCPIENSYLGRNMSCECSLFSAELTSVTIGNLVTSIDGVVFKECTGLTAVTIMDGSSALKLGNNGDTGLFSDCPLKSVYLGRDLSYSSSPFKDQSELASLTIGSSVTKVYGSLLKGCTGLVSVTIEDGSNSLEMMKNYSGDTYYSVFSDCPVKSLYLGRNLKYTSSDSPFKEQLELTKVTIGNTVNEIGDYEFQNCTALTSVTIPNSVTSIGNWAFDGCDALVNFTIPNSVTYIGKFIVDGVCYYMSDLTCTVTNGYEDYTGDVEIAEEVTYGGRTFPVTTIGDYAFKGCTSLTGVDIPNSVTGIGREAFYGCASLMGVDIPNSVIEIGRESFYECSGLISVDIPNSVTQIGVSAFQHCSGIKKVTIGSSVKSIDSYAFYGCPDIISVTCLSTKTPYASYLAFSPSTYESTILYVPYESRDVYKATTCWKEFSRVWGISVPTSVKSPTFYRSALAEIYNLQGHRLAQPQRGINIINGKKVLVK